MPALEAQPISMHELLGDPSRNDRLILSRSMCAINDALWGHARAVAELVERLAEPLGIVGPARTALIDAAWLHDIGKLPIPQTILDKPGRLDQREWAIVRQHAANGADYLAKSARLTQSASIVRYHHERYNGRGYPAGLAGVDIPLSARVVAVADAYHAMTSARPYRPAKSPVDAIAELRRCAGSQFDPGVVEILVRILREQNEPDH